MDRLDSSSGLGSTDELEPDADAFDDATLEAVNGGQPPLGSRRCEQSQPNLSNHQFPVEQCSTQEVHHPAVHSSMSSSRPSHHQIPGPGPRGPVPPALPQATPQGGHHPGQSFPGTEGQEHSQQNIFIHTENVNINSMVVQNNMFLMTQPSPRYPTAGRQNAPTFDQANCKPAQPEDVSHKFKEEELKRPVKELYLTWVAKGCDETSNWRRLARKMDMDQPTLSRLEQHYHDDTPELIFQLLQAWHRRSATRPTVHDLVKLLCNSKLQGAALELISLFRSVHGQQ